ncbi:MAG: hypothetical protein JXQ71_02025 [Verrucomicrobia bacterium]|nr:hypothetical protein [Verrucomicrobiota bacterium]
MTPILTHPRPIPRPDPHSTPCPRRALALGPPVAFLLLLSALLLPAAAQDATASTPADYSSFRIIAERNIFNANRSGRTIRPSPETSRPRRVDAITLVGTMDYRKGLFAFFNGTSPEFRQILPPGHSIAGYKIAAVTSGSVQLQSETNALTLKVGMQLHREDQGPWTIRESTQEFVSTRSEPTRSDFGRADFGRGGSRGFDPRRNDSRESDSRRGDSRGGYDPRRNQSPTPTTFSPSSPTAQLPAAAPAPDDAEVLRRLMEQRARELQ